MVQQGKSSQSRPQGLRQELEKLHVSIGMNHSIIEDPALFMTLGLNAFWLWVPRLMTVILFVHMLRLWQWSGKRFFHQNISMSW
jgi:hypothetical protein